MKPSLPASALPLILIVTTLVSWSVSVYIYLHSGRLDGFTTLLGLVGIFFAMFAYNNSKKRGAGGGD